MLYTNVLIACERGTIDRAAMDADELAVAAVSIAGYRVGIALADALGPCRRRWPLSRPLSMAWITPGRGRLLRPADRARPPGRDAPRSA
jgi:hypothetical protein